jgi:hypothetical protein
VHRGDRDSHLILQRLKRSVPGSVAPDGQTNVVVAAQPDNVIVPPSGSAFRLWSRRLRRAGIEGVQRKRGFVAGHGHDAFLVEAQLQQQPV